MSRLRKLSTSAAMTGIAVGAIAVLTAGTAAAATTVYSAGTDPNPAITYTCTFPGIPAQPVTVTAHLSAPDTVPSGTTITPTDVGGTATVSATVHALLTAVGLDGIRGSATVPVTATSGTLSQPAATGLDIPETIYPAGGPITVIISQVPTSSIPNYTAGPAGTATLKLGTPISAALQFHKASDGSWSNWTMNCTLKAQSPAQNTSFTPDLNIS
ncbi:DUF6801 domain-containing protein [Amycolatopsis saalfeldensis]|uniref:DUF6801 domain-containing protein n=1 Tax=Amycolatopsis saalfeldensis TaxID=394193 RepID=A0A1H8YJ58_9PSEU|nr:DUF6801 domain-containing protein [Amycolatopsis saalfeldensis]SEP51448.1 hypothetical protein SAMN04489732_11642 [Amycolatopsis saalfeldensis]